MRIALLGHGSRGDVQPMIALGAALRRRGHVVVVGAPPGFSETITAAGLEAQEVGQAARAYIESHAADYTAGALRGAVAVHRHMLEEVEAQFRRVVDIARGCDLVVGAGLQLAARSVAEALSIAYRYVVYCPALLESRAHSPVLLPPSRLPAWANRFAWRALQMIYNHTVLPALNRERRALGLRPVLDLYHHVLGERPLLATDPELARPPRDCAPRPEQTGYLHPDEGAPLPGELEAFLAAGPAPVYVGFGSMGCPAPATTTRTIGEALTSLGVRGIIGSGWAGLGDDLPDSCIRVDAVSHLRLFPRVAAAVHHGGAGTTAAAARAGVPQVVVPHIADQFYWGDRVARAGLGARPVPRAQLTARRLADAIAEALLSPETRRRAQAVGAALRRRDAAEATADALLAALD